MLVNNHRSLIIIVVLPLLVLIGSCSKLCNSGYEGSRCNQLSTTKFVGKWSAIDTPGTLIYTDTITQGSVIEDLILSSSFSNHHFSHNVLASVINNVLTIPYQQPDSSNIFVAATGTMSDDHNTIVFAYQITVGADSTRVTTIYGGTWTRQN